MPILNNSAWAKVILDEFDLVHERELSHGDRWVSKLRQLYTTLRRRGKMNLFWQKLQLADQYFKVCLNLELTRLRHYFLDINIQGLITWLDMPLNLG